MSHTRGLMDLLNIIDCYCMFVYLITQVTSSMQDWKWDKRDVHQGVRWCTEEWTPGSPNSSCSPSPSTLWRVSWMQITCFTLVLHYFNVYCFAFTINITMALVLLEEIDSFLSETSRTEHFLEIEILWIFIIFNHVLIFQRVWKSEWAATDTQETVRRMPRNPVTAWGGGNFPHSQPRPDPCSLLNSSVQFGKTVYRA